MKRIKFTPDVMEQINITPMMDTAMTLLLIFVIISPIIGRAIEVELPAAGGETAAVSTTVIVTVERDGTLYLAGRPVRAALLPGSLADLKKENPGMKLLVQADRAVQYDRVVMVLDAARRAGIGAVGLSTRSPRREDFPRE